MTTQRLTPKHQTVLDALSAVTSGMYLGSIKGRIGPKISGDELDDILRDLAVSYTHLTLPTNREV